MFSINPYIACSVFFMAFFITGCKKDHTASPPGITILKPTEGQTVYQTDTLLIQCKVWDEISVKTLSISLYESSTHAPKGNSKIIHIHEKEKTITTQWIFNSYDLSPGTYYLKFTASNENLSTSKYVTISVNASPQEFKQVFFTSFDGFNTTVYTYDGNTCQPWMSSPGDIQDAICNSTSQQWIIMGKYQRNLQAYEIPYKNLAWEEPIISNFPDLYWLQLCPYKQYVFVSYKQGIVKKFLSDGTYQQTLFVLQNHYPDYLYADNQYVMVEEKSSIGTDTKLGVFYATSGAPYNHYSLQEDLIYISAIGNNIYLIITLNTQNKTTLYEYNAMDNLLTAKNTLHFKSICACSWRPGYLLLADNTGNLYELSLSSFSASLILSTPFSDIRDIAADIINQRIYVAHSQGMDGFQYPNGNSVVSFPLLNGSEKVSILYNY